MDSINIALFSALLGIVATVLTMYRNAKKETQEDTQHSTSVREELKYISRGIEDIKYDTKSLAASITNMNERLIRAEESIKSAHEKIDKIEHIKNGGK